MIALKTPQLVIHGGTRPVVGSLLEIVVETERSAHGYDTRVVDVYEPDPGMVRWDFARRVKRFHRTIHFTLNGMRYRCKRCEAVWTNEPRRGEQVLWEATHES